MADYIKNPAIREITKDMRKKPCKICGKVKLIHKYDAFCKRCKSAANRISRANSSIFY